GPAFDVSAAHDVKRGKNQLALHVDDRKVRILVSGDERVLTVVQLLATADTEHVRAWGLAGNLGGLASDGHRRRVVGADGRHVAVLEANAGVGIRRKMTVAKGDR